MKAIRPYLPTLGMVLAAVLQALYTSLQDNRLSTSEILVLVYALLGAFTLYVIPKVQGVTWLKPLIAGLTTAVVALQTGLADGVLSGQDYVQVAIQLLVGFGIVVATNKHVPVTPNNAAVVGVA